MTDTSLLTPDEVAARLRVGVPTLYQWRYLGEGPPAIKLGRLLRYERAAVDKWIADQKSVA